MKISVVFLAIFLFFSPDKNKVAMLKKRNASYLPGIEVYDLKGNHTRLNLLGKNKLTIIDNWFIPCPPCFMEMSMLHKLYFKYRSNKNINFITICRTDSAIVKKFLAKDKSMATFLEWYHERSKRTDFQLPIYFIPGCNEKIFTGTTLSNYAPDDRSKCPDKLFNFRGYPTLIIFDKKGKLIFKKTGYTESDEASYTARLESIIKSGIASVN